MRVEQMMTSPVTTIEARGRLAEAHALMQAGHFRHLPVVDDGRLVGIVTERNLLRALLADAGLGQPTARRAGRSRGTLGSMITVGQRAWRAGAGAGR